MTRNSSRRWLGGLLLAACLVAPQARAQAGRMPEAYSVAEFNSMLGQGAVMRVFRDGARAMIDISGAQVAGGALAFHTRAYYDLELHRVYTLNMNRSESACSVGNFSGDWGDPFEMSAAILDDLAAQNAQLTGTETVNGFATKVITAGAAGQRQAKVWVDPASGLIIKAQFGAIIAIDVKQLSLARPPAQLLVLPPTCAAAPPPHPPS
jgi:hypothetical protein